MRIATSIATVVLMIGTAPATIAHESSSEVSRDGACPKGFKASGSSCKSGSQVAIIKIGSCPTGFKASANYCVGDKGDYAEVRSGSCPSGLKTSGKYCIK